MATPSTTTPMAGRTLLDDDEHTAVVRTVLDTNPGMTEEAAARVVDQALAFVATAAAFPQAVIAPSRVVDEGWHALILHTDLYASLCDRLGTFVHHYPEPPGAERHDPEATERTTTAIGEAGYAVDYALWTGPDEGFVPVAANCAHTPRPGGCGPIGPGGNPKPDGAGDASSYVPAA